MAQTEETALRPPLNKQPNDEWAQHCLGNPDVATIVMGQSPASSTYNTSGSGLPFFQGKIDFGLRHPKPSTWCSSPLRIAEPGDVLISVRAPVGDANIATQKCCIGRGIAALRSGPKAHNEFLFYLLLHHKPGLDALGTGATFKAINKDTLYSFEVLLPPLPEQRVIAVVLSKIQAAVEVQENIVATLKELNAATMAKLFREGLRGEPLKQTEIGEIPASWEVRPLGSLAQVSTGTTPSTTNTDYYVGDVPFVKTAEIDNNIITRSRQNISRHAVQHYSLRIYPPGSIFLAMYGQGKTRGRASILGIPATTTQNTAAIEARSALHGEYLWHYLLSQYETLRGIGNLGHLSHLNLGYVKELLIPVPSPEEQIEIKTILTGLQNREQIATQRQQELNKLFSSMLHVLMTGQVRVIAMRETT